MTAHTPDQNDAESIEADEVDAGDQVDDVATSTSEEAESVVPQTAAPKNKSKNKSKNKTKKKTEGASGDRRGPNREVARPTSRRARAGEYLDPRRHPVLASMAVLCVVAVIASVVLGVLLQHSSSELAANRDRDQSKADAEKAAGDYAVGAATFSYENLDPWSASLKKGTAPELSSRFDVAVKTLTPLIQEVQWNQTAKLIAAKTTAVRGDRQYVVQVFVSTHMTSTQNPNGLNTVTPYTVTLDRGDNWLITDVAGIAGAAQDGAAGSGTPNLAPTDSGAPAPPQTPTPAG